MTLGRNKGIRRRARGTQQKPKKHNSNNHMECLRIWMTISATSHHKPLVDVDMNGRGRVYGTHSMLAIMVCTIEQRVPSIDKIKHSSY